jgi:plastocyanin
MTASRACAVLGSLALVAGVAGCGGDDNKDGSGSSQPAQTQTGTQTKEQGGGAATAADQVSIADFKFKPDTISVKKGTKLTWSNDDQAAHTATADDRAFDTQAIAQGEQKSVTLSKPGTFAYHCDFHPFMKGTVVVK